MPESDFRIGIWIRIRHRLGHQDLTQTSGSGSESERKPMRLDVRVPPTNKIKDLTISLLVVAEREGFEPFERRWQNL